MVPGHNWRWGRTEIAPWIMRQWCIDTLIKGKLRLRPFGCCGFDERGLSDSISTCRYGRSFWWLTLWKGTQHQCRVTALIFTLPRLLLVKFEIKACLARASVTPQLEVSQSVFFYFTWDSEITFYHQRELWKAVWCRFCSSDQNQMEPDDFGLLKSKARSHITSAAGQLCTVTLALDN